MKLKQIREMNCGCTVDNNVISMCPMHEAAPELREAAERLLRAHYKASKDPDWDERYREAMEMGSKYMPTSDMMGALVGIEEILDDGEDAYNLIEAVADEVPGENQNHQPKLS